MANTELSMASVYARYLPLELERAGYDPAPFIKRQNLTQAALNDVDARLSYQTYSALLRDIFAKTDIPVLGLRTAGHINLLKHGLMGYAMSCCKDLRHAFEVYANYSRLQSDIIDDRFDVEGKTAIHSMNTTLFWGNEEIARFEAEQHFAMWFQSAEAWWGESCDWFQEVHFSFERPGHASFYEDFFHCPVKFGQTTNEFRFHTDYLKKPFASFDTQMIRLTEEHGTKLLQEHAQSGVLSSRIRTHLSQCGNRIPSSQNVAAHLKLSEITMRRRLKREGTNYKALLYEFRMNLASRYLIETDLPVKEIAYLTGYGNPGNFTRAFTLFFSLPPLQYRLTNADAVGQ